jgi:hypothetical protein
MIKGEILCAKVFSAILAVVVITKEDVGPRKLNGPLVGLHLDHFEETQNGWKLEVYRNTVDLPFVDLQDFHFSLPKEADGPSPIDHPQGLIG